MRRYVATLAVLIFAAAPLHAQEPTATDPHAARVANEVSHEVLSPFCPGKTLAMCPSPAAAEVRMQIQDMAESGMEVEAIKEAIIEEHGEKFRIVEPPWTDNLGLFGALGGAFLVAVLVVVSFSRRRTGAEPASAPPAAAGAEPEPEDPYTAALRKQYRD